MNEYNYSSDGVPIRTDRIFDSCSDKDCFSGLPVTLEGGGLPQNISVVRGRSAEVSGVTINVEPVPFNRGFYQIDLTFSFRLELLGYERSGAAPDTFTGTCTASKSCILFGSESSARTFTVVDPAVSSEAADSGMLPRASVSVIDPMILETRIDSCERATGMQNIAVTLGLFSVLELSRPVTIMVPAMEYSIPGRECCPESETPCEIFDRLKFPDEEFSPLSLPQPKRSSDDIA